jgi:hypothetical protein
MTASLSLLLALSTFGQATDRDSQNDSAARLELMKQSVASYTLRKADDRTELYHVQAEPAMRFNNPVGAVRDGTIFLWLGADDRPAAAVQVFQHDNGTWYQAFSSLSTVPLISTGVWNPARRGVELRPIPGVPRPAATAEQRFRQMRDLTSGFGAEMYLDRKTWHNLRLLSKPLARYGKPESDALDGGLFAFVLTTDPEVFLLLEAGPGPDGPEWQYAFAPEASSPLRGSWKRSAVWNFDPQGTANSARSPYFVYPVPR